MINCCARKQKTNLYKVETKEAKIFKHTVEEYIEVLDKCNHCNNTTIVYERYEIGNGKKIFEDVLTGKRAKKFLDKKIINKKDKFKKFIPLYKSYSDFHYYDRHPTNNKKQVKRKVYGGVSTMKLGLFDYDKGLTNSYTI